ncbi:MAG: hypothetical protein LBJ76_05515 [Candidatus Accumulibacter sp.]|nr:hypothetical protein [Accumulibacter sp.]
MNKFLLSCLLSALLIIVPMAAFVNKFLLSCLLTAFLFIVPVASFITPGMENLGNERRGIATFPEMPSKLRSGSVKKFFREIDNFFADHFPLRTPLLELSVALYEAGGDSLDMNKSYKGKGNWLFLGNSYARCVDKLQGRVILSRDSLKRQTEAYSNIRDAAKRKGVEFFVFIGPNKSSIYPEYLPPVAIPARRRFISPLLETLNEAGIKVYDPTDRLVGEKSGGLLYYRADTHWNARGAYEAFEGFRKWVGLPELPSLSLVEAPAYAGDLVDISGIKTFLCLSETTSRYIGAFPLPCMKRVA